jgi:alkylation response protein AidB-like acyl-CoA dehydrogenase
MSAVTLNLAGDDNSKPAVAPLRRARAIRPLLEAAGARIEAARELTEDVLAAMHEAELFRVLLPRSVGGAELEPVDYVQVVEAIAMGDGSTAWCLGQGSGCALAAGFLEPAIAREVFGPPNAVLAWGYGPNGRAEVVPGGYRVTGHWLFASGSRHATWLGGHSIVIEPDGKTRLDEDGMPAERTMLFPRDRARIDDVWQVMGLRGTGSDSYAVKDLFVPEAYSFARDVDADRREPGTLFRFSTSQLYAAGFAGVALGLARATLDAFTKLAREKTSAATKNVLRDSAVVQSAIAVCEARWRSARAFLLQTLREIWDDVAVSGAPTLDQRMTVRLASTYAIQQAKEIVDLCYQEAGATAIFESQPFERRFRDMHAVTQQVQAHTVHFETVGQHLLGLPTSLRFV